MGEPSAGGCLCRWRACAGSPAPFPRPESEVAPDISRATSDFGRAKDEATVGDRRQATGDTAGGHLCKVHSTSETTRNYPIALSIDDAIADLNVWVSELDKCVP